MNPLNPSSIPALTRREQEILVLIAQGHSSKQIAGKLQISENTVANHRKNMLGRTGAQSSAELIHRINKTNISK